MRAATHDLEIRNRHTGCVIMRVPGRNLRGALLADSVLEDADLRGADLRARGWRWWTIVSVQGMLLGIAGVWWVVRGPEQWVLNCAVVGATALNVVAILCNARTSLVRANLDGADLGGANLDWADLRGASMRRANLEGASLRGALLAQADLREAGLQRADLRAVTLAQADLRGADLSDARVTDRSVPTDAVYDERTVWPCGFRPRPPGNGNRERGTTDGCRH